MLMCCVCIAVCVLGYSIRICEHLRARELCHVKKMFRHSQKKHENILGVGRVKFCSLKSGGGGGGGGGGGINEQLQNENVFT